MTEWRHKYVRMRRYTYDAKARLTSAWRRPCGSADYEFIVSNVYDHLDRRVQKITPVATHYNSSTPNSSTRQLYIPWYDAFGKLIASSGPMVDVFAVRYSTKYFDPETGFYYYGYRFYSPEQMRWITRYPIGEDGGVNLYAMCGNNSIYSFDAVGMWRMISGAYLVPYGTREAKLFWERYSPYNKEGARKWWEE